jgi:hypothetical protein
MLRMMVQFEQFRGHEYILTRNTGLLDALAYFGLIAIGPSAASWLAHAIRNYDPC